MSTPKEVCRIVNAAEPLRAAQCRGRAAFHRLALWAAGLRYRKDIASLPGRPDIAFTKAKVCVFCDGDFWHGRDWGRRRTKLLRGANSDYWIAKIEGNIERDLRRTRELEAAGWLVLRFWERDLLANVGAAVAAIEQALVSRRQ